VDFAQLAVFSDKVSRLDLDLLDVVFNFDRVVPGNLLAFAAFAFRVFDQVLKLLKFFQHHWFLAIDHLVSK